MKAVIMAAPAMDGSTTSIADIDEPQAGGQAADRAHGRSGRRAGQFQRDVGAAAGHLVQEHHGGRGHG